MWTSSRPHRAGTSAQRRYRELYRAWRRRVWPLMAGLGILGLGFATIGWAMSGGWAWAFAFGGGLFIGALLWILVSPPDRIISWQWGSEGERRTAKRLNSLDRQTWFVWHDLVREDGTNIDHVVAGPSGIFVMDTKDWHGILSASDTGLTVQWREDATVNKRYEPQRSVAHAAVELHDLLLERAHVNTFVQAVVVIWGSFPQTHEQVGNVWFVHGDALASWLTAQPLRSVDLSRVIASLDELCERGLP